MNAPALSLTVPPELVEAIAERVAELLAGLRSARHRRIGVSDRPGHHGNN